MRHEFRDFARRRDNRSSPLERTTRKLVGTGTALAGARPSKPTGFHGTSGAIQLGADSDLLHAPGATVTVAEPDTPPAVAVTTAVPLLRAVTKPAESTAATPG